MFFLPRRKILYSAKKGVSVFVAICFLSMTLLPSIALAQSVAGLPIPGTLLATTSSFTPLMLRGIQINPENPFEFNFLLDTGSDSLNQDEIKSQSETIAKYFLSTLTIPEEDLWVNLSPHEENRIAPDALSQTDMGRDLLAQDYILKQLTASLIHPDDETGKVFWKKVYKKAYEEYGTTQIPVDTFNKVWIVPNKATIYQEGNRAFVAESYMKVMLETDYLALEKSAESQGARDAESKADNALASQVVREVLIPLLEKEVNEGKLFSKLRQMYHSMILATWYKQNLKSSIINKIYSDQSKVKGVETPDPEIVNKIYDQYLEAFDKGVCDLIKKEKDPVTDKVFFRKYFSGGFDAKAISSNIKVKSSPRFRSVVVRNIVGMVFSAVFMLMSPTHLLAQSQASPASETSVNLDDDIFKMNDYFFYETEAEIIYGRGSGQGLADPEHLEDVAVDSDGNIWLVDYEGDQVIVIDKKTGKPKIVDRKFESPAGLRIDEEDNIWIAEFYDGKIVMLDRKTGEWIFKGTFNHPSDIEFDDKGNVWVSEWGSEYIWMMNKETGKKEIVEEGFEMVNDIAFDQDGNLWITDFKKGCVFMRDKTGKLDVVKRNLNSPRDVAIDNEGNVWIAEEEADRIWVRLKNTGEWKIFPMEFSRPYGIAFDNQGNLLVSETSGKCLNRIKKTFLPLPNISIQGINIPKSNLDFSAATITSTIELDDIVRVVGQPTNIKNTIYFDYHSGYERGENGRTKVRAVGRWNRDYPDRPERNPRGWLKKVTPKDYVVDENGEIQITKPLFKEIEIRELMKEDFAFIQDRYDQAFNVMDSDVLTAKNHLNQARVRLEQLIKKLSAETSMDNRELVFESLDKTVDVIRGDLEAVENFEKHGQIIVSVHEKINNFNIILKEGTSSEARKREAEKSLNGLLNSLTQNQDILKDYGYDTKHAIDFLNKIAKGFDINNFTSTSSKSDAQSLNQFEQSTNSEILKSIAEGDVFGIEDKNGFTAFETNTPEQKHLAREVITNASNTHQDLSVWVKNPESKKGELIAMNPNSTRTAASSSIASSALKALKKTAKIAVMISVFALSFLVQSCAQESNKQVQKNVHDLLDLPGTETPSVNTSIQELAKDYLWKAPAIDSLDAFVARWPYSLDGRNAQEKVEVLSHYIKNELGVLSLGNDDSDLTQKGEDFQPRKGRDLTYVAQSKAAVCTGFARLGFFLGNYLGIPNQTFRASDQKQGDFDHEINIVFSDGKAIIWDMSTGVEQSIVSKPFDFDEYYQKIELGDGEFEYVLRPGKTFDFLIEKQYEYPGNLSDIYTRIAPWFAHDVNQLTDLIKKYENEIQELYSNAIDVYNSGDYESAQKLFSEIHLQAETLFTVNFKNSAVREVITDSDESVKKYYILLSESKSLDLAIGDYLKGNRDQASMPPIEKNQFGVWYFSEQTRNIQNSMQRSAELFEQQKFEQAKEEIENYQKIALKLKTDISDRGLSRILVDPAPVLQEIDGIIGASYQNIKACEMEIERQKDRTYYWDGKSDAKDNKNAKVSSSSLTVALKGFKIAMATSMAAGFLSFLPLQFFGQDKNNENLVVDGNFNVSWPSAFGTPDFKRGKMLMISYYVGGKGKKGEGVYSKIKANQGVYHISFDYIVKPAHRTYSERNNINICLFNKVSHQPNGRVQEVVPKYLTKEGGAYIIYSEENIEADGKSRHFEGYFCIPANQSYQYVGIYPTVDKTPGVSKSIVGTVFDDLTITPFSIDKIPEHKIDIPKSDLDFSAATITSTIELDDIARVVGKPTAIKNTIYFDYHSGHERGEDGRTKVRAVGVWNRDYPDRPERTPRGWLKKVTPKDYVVDENGEIHITKPLFNEINIKELMKEDFAFIQDQYDQAFDILNKNVVASKNHLNQAQIRLDQVVRKLLAEKDVDNIEAVFEALDKISDVISGDLEAIENFRIQGETLADMQMKVNEVNAALEEVTAALESDIDTDSQKSRAAKAFNDAIAVISENSLLLEKLDYDAQKAVVVIENILRRLGIENFSSKPSNNDAQSMNQFEQSPDFEILESIAQGEVFGIEGNSGFTSLETKTLEQQHLAREVILNASNIHQDLSVWVDNPEKNTLELISINSNAYESGKTRTTASSNVGGIDLNAQYLDLKTQGIDMDFELPLEWQGVDLSNVPGLIPVFIQITPVINFPAFVAGEEDIENNNAALAFHQPLIEQKKDFIVKKEFNI